MAQLEIRNLHVALEDGTEIVKGVDLEVDLGAEARDHGAERLGQVDARVRAHGASRLRGDRGPDPVRRRGRDRARRRRARAARPLPRLPVPARDSRRHRHELPAQRDQRAAARPRTAARTTRFRSPSSGPSLLAAMEDLKVPRELASRYLNDGFSGGEKKRVEILQMAMLKPKIADPRRDRLGPRHRRARRSSRTASTRSSARRWARSSSPTISASSTTSPRTSSTSSSTGASSPRAAPSSPTSSRPTATRRSSPSR